MNPEPTPSAKPNKNGYLTSFGERASYGFYFFGQNIFYFLLTLFFSPFVTDIGVAAATAGVISIVVKIWDAVNDPIFGGIVDRVQFKKGKFLPWLKISLFLIPIATILFFAIPTGASAVVKIIWISVAYILWDTAYTICDVPIFGIVTTMTDNLHERTTLITIGRIFAGVATAALYMIIPQIRQAIGGWFPTTLLFSVVGFAVMIPIIFKAKERIRPVVTEQEVGLKAMFRYIAHNKYLLIFYLSMFIYSSTNIGGGIALYFARYILDNEGSMTLVAALTLVPGLLVAVFIPAMTKKIDKFHLYFWSTAANALLGVLTFFIGYRNFYLLMALIVLRAVPSGIAGALLFMFTPDCVEYGLYKTGVSAPGISFSIQTFTAKLTGAISTALGLFALAVIGFVSGEGAVQAAGFDQKFWLVYMLVPAIGSLLSLPVLRLYKLRDKDVQVMAKCNAGELPRAEADALLEGRYQ